MFIASLSEADVVVQLADVARRSLRRLLISAAIMAMTLSDTPTSSPMIVWTLKVQSSCLAYLAWERTLK